MNGSYSIKEIVKSIPGDIVYDKNDDIAGGAEAQLAWFLYTDPNTSNNDKDEIRKNLLEYCSKDTLAIYYLIKYLMKPELV